MNEFYQPPTSCSLLLHTHLTASATHTLCSHLVSGHEGDRRNAITPISLETRTRRDAGRRLSQTSCDLMAALGPDSLMFQLNAIKEPSARLHQINTDDVWLPPDKIPGVGSIPRPADALWDRTTLST